MKTNAKLNAKKIAVIGALSAIALVLVGLIRIPIVLFLSYEPKDVAIMLGGLIFGPMTALAVSVISSTLEMVFLSNTGIIGWFMNVLSTVAFTCTASYIYTKKQTMKGAIIGLLTGWSLMILVMLLWNYLITPLYMGVPRAAVLKLLPTAILPFNLFKGGINIALTLLLYKPVITALRKKQIVAGSAGPGQGKDSLGVILIAAVLIVSSVLLVLAVNGKF